MVEGIKKTDRPSFRRLKETAGHYTDDVASKKRHYGVYIGHVKNTQDVQHMGRLSVWLPDWGGEEDNPRIWKTVSYCAPFGGSTPGMERHWDRGHSDYDFTPTSYGFWAVPPDIGNKVLVMFINGEEQRGIWIGVLYDSYMNFAVPGLAAYDKHNGCAYYPQMPTSEYNKFDHGITTPLIPPVRPYHKRQLERLGQTAQLEDPYRGWTTSSAQRETPSHVYGMSTPGPIDEEAASVSETFKRAGGHQFVMDDGDINGENRLIRLRTRGGAQILIHDSGGFVYICNKNASAWVELDQAGNIELFSNNTISLRTNEDLNLRVDRDLNLDIGRDINLHMPANYVSKAPTAHKDIKKTFDYEKIEGLKTPVPDGSIVYWLPEGEIHGQIDKGNVFRRLIKGDFHNLLDEGDYYRHLKGGDVQHTLDAGDYTRWLKAGNVDHLLDGGYYDLTVAQDTHIKTKGSYVNNADVGVDVRANQAVHIESADNSVHVKALGSIHNEAISGYHFTRAGAGIRGSAPDFHIDAVLYNGTAYINNVYGTFSLGSASVSPAHPADAALIANEAFPANPAEPPVLPELTEWIDVLAYESCVGPELEPTDPIRVTRYPTMEPWGGIIGPGQGTEYHIDVITTGTNDAVGAITPEQEPIPADPLDVPVRPGSVSPNAVAAHPVDGVPRTGMKPGQYASTGYDEQGNPVYKKVGETTAQAAANAQLGGKGVDMIKKFEGFNSHQHKDVHGNDVVGYGHKLKKESVVTTIMTDISSHVDEITVGSTAGFEQTGEAILNPPEVVSYQGITHTKLLGVTRGLRGTVARMHKAMSNITFSGENYNNITKSKAMELFNRDMKEAVDTVRTNVTVPVNQNQVDSLVSLTRNIGPAEFKKSKLLKELNGNNMSNVTHEFMRYNKLNTVEEKVVNGVKKQVPIKKFHKGLHKRRIEEARLFSQPTTVANKKLVKSSQNVSILSQSVSKFKTSLVPNNITGKYQSTMVIDEGRE